MNAKGWKRALSLCAVVGALVLAASGCNDNGDVLTPPGGGGGGAGLVTTASSPTNGDTTLTATGTLAVNNGNSGFDELVLSETVGAVGHEVTVTWDTTTHAINSVVHSWFDGTTGGFVQCAPGANVCPASKINIDFAGHVVTFSNDLALPGALDPTQHSTLNGTIVW